MLKQRILTALVLIPLIALTLLYAPFAVFAIVSTAIFAIAAWEWASLANCNRIVKICYVLVCSLAAGVLVGACNQLNYQYDDKVNDMLKIFDVLTICWWFIIAIAVVIYPKAKNVLTSKVLLLLAAGLLTLVPAWHGLLVCFNHASGRIIVTLLLAVSIIADTGAYFSGKYFGKTPLAPQVSPKKTIEGLAGAIILSVIFCLLAIIIWKGYTKESLEIYEVSHVLFMVFCLVIIAALGDLWESLVKRVHNVKDSGSILPGHGGILDRIDSHIAVFALFPVFYRIIENFYR